MPPKRQRPSFGGSLLHVPPPLPDEDTEPDDPPATVASVPQPVPVPPDPEPALPAPEPPAPAESPVPTGGREKPPSTLRLNAEAGGRLWQAYLVRKQADPFLTYTRFASAIVLRGLGGSSGSDST